MSWRRRIYESRGEAQERNNMSIDSIQPRQDTDEHGFFIHELRELREVSPIELALIPEIRVTVLNPCPSVLNGLFRRDGH
jgi:hypothetical protein